MAVTVAFLIWVPIVLVKWVSSASSFTIRLPSGVIYTRLVSSVWPLGSFARLAVRLILFIDVVAASLPR